MLHRQRIFPKYVLSVSRELYFTPPKSNSSPLKNDGLEDEFPFGSKPIWEQLYKPLHFGISLFLETPTSSHLFVSGSSTDARKNPKVFFGWEFPISNCNASILAGEVGPIYRYFLGKPQKHARDLKDVCCHTVDGSEIPNNQPGMYSITKQTVKNGINYQPQLVSRISSINCIYQDVYIHTYTLGMAPSR